VNRDQIFAAMAEERRCIADLIGDIDEAQLASIFRATCSGRM